MREDTVSAGAAGQQQQWGREVQANWRQYVRPLLGRLRQQVDGRLVRTRREGAEAMLRLRLRPQALWLTELGSVLLSTAQAPAGVKRIARLLAAQWSASAIEQWLLEQADARVAAQPAGESWVSFDQSVGEQPEAARAEGLCRVRSGKARRLGRWRPRFSSGPPPRPALVPGWHWLAATVTGWSGADLPCWPAAALPLVESDGAGRS